MCKNMTRTSIFNLTSMDIDMLGDTSKDGSRASSFEVNLFLPLHPFQVSLRTGPSLESP
jgi:hypothetical protein